MKTFRFFLAGLMLLAAASQAQNTLPTVSNTVGGNLTSAGTDCSLMSSCVGILAPSSAATASIQLSGTFVATVQFETSTGGSVWVSASPASATAAGSYSFTLSGALYLRARASAYTSGSVRVDISTGAGGSGGGGTALPTPPTTPATQLYTAVNQVTGGSVGGWTYSAAQSVPACATSVSGPCVNPSSAMVNSRFPTSYAVGVTTDTLRNSDWGGLNKYAAPGVVVVAIPQAGIGSPVLFTYGWNVVLQSVGGISLYSTVSTINGTTYSSGSPLSIPAGFSVLVTSDGTNYQTVISANSATGVTLQTNAVNNASQSTLNLAAGTNVTLSNSGGTVTVNAAGGGGTVTDNINFPLGLISGGSCVAAPGIGVGSANIPQASFASACNQITNTQSAVIGINFAHSALAYIYINTVLHAAWTGTLGVTINYFSGTGTAANAYVTAAAACVAPGSSMSGATYTDATVLASLAGTSGVMGQASVATLTTTGSCAAGSYLMLRIGRDGTQGTDVSTASFNVTHVTLKEQHN